MAADVEPGFTLLSTVTTFDGWKARRPHRYRRSIRRIRQRGQPLLFYVVTQSRSQTLPQSGCETDPGANGGIYFHTKYQEKGFPKFGLSVRSITPTRLEKDRQPL